MTLEFEDDEECGHGPISCPVLVTERLVLRPPHPDDVEDLVRLANNRRIAQMLTRMPHPYGGAEAENFLKMAAARKQGCIYALAHADTGAFIGCAGLEDRSGNGYEIGYWIGEPHWGRGYATEAAHALVDLGFRATPAETLHANCRVTNAASRRVLQKCGFQYAGQGMQTSLAAGQVTVERYSLDRTTWVSLKSWVDAK